MLVLNQLLIKIYGNIVVTNLWRWYFFTFYCC